MNPPNAGSACGERRKDETGFTGTDTGNHRRCPMRLRHILPLLAMLLLLGCDGTGGWLRGPGTATAYAAPLASDTTVVTTRRVWTSFGSNTGTRFTPSYGAMIMPDGAGMAATDWETGDPAIFDLASKEFRRFRINGEPYDTGLGLETVPSPDGSQLAVAWHSEIEPQVQLRIVDVATGESRTIMTRDSAVALSLQPVAWTLAGDSVFALLLPSFSPGGDVEVLLIPTAGGMPRLVHAIPRTARPYRMSLSHDGRWLLYAHALSRAQESRSDIYIIDVQGGGARPLVEHSAREQLVGWLPGTDVVLFTSDRSGTTDLWSIGVADGRGTGEPRLVRSGFFRSEAVGFGDGGLFYTVGTGSVGLAVVSVDPHSGALQGPASLPLPHLRSPPRGVTWSADGQTLVALTAWGGGSNALTLHSMDTGESRVFWLDDEIQVRALEWAADGTTLLLRVAETRSWTGPTHLLRLDLLTGSTTRLFAAAELEEPGSHSGFLVTPDGRSIVLRQQHTLDDGRTEMTLVLRALADGSERELHRTAGFIPEFFLSADGTQLAFMQQVWEDSDSLFVMRMDGSQPLRYVASWDYDTVSLLGWLPAGNALLGARLTGPYSGSSGEGGPSEEILRIELDGSATVVGISPFRPVRGAKVQGFHRSRLVLSPAGNRLAHQHAVDAGHEIWRMDGLHELFANTGDGRR